MNRMSLRKHLGLMAQGATVDDALNSLINDPELNDKQRALIERDVQAGKPARNIFRDIAVSLPVQAPEPLTPVSTERAGGLGEAAQTLVNPEFLKPTAEAGVRIAAPMITGALAAPMGPVSTVGAVAGTNQALDSLFRALHGQSAVPTTQDIGNRVLDVAGMGLGARAAMSPSSPVRGLINAGITGAQETLGRFMSGAPQLDQPDEGSLFDRWILPIWQRASSPMLAGALSARAAPVKSLEPGVEPSPVEKTLGQVTGDPVAAREASNFLQAMVSMGEDQLGRDVTGNPTVQANLKQLFESISQPAKNLVVGAIQKQQAGLKPGERFASPNEATTEMANIIEPAVKSTEITTAAPSAEVMSKMAPNQPQAIAGVERMKQLGQDLGSQIESLKQTISPESLVETYSQLGKQGMKEIPETVRIQQKAASEQYGKDLAEINRLAGGQTMAFTPDELPAKRDLYSMIAPSVADPKILGKLDRFLNTTEPTQVTVGDLTDLYQGLGKVGRGMDPGAAPFRQIKLLKNLIEAKVGQIGTPEVLAKFDEMNQKYASEKGGIQDFERAAGRVLADPNETFGAPRVGNILAENVDRPTDIGTLLADPRLASIQQQARTVRQGIEGGKQQIKTLGEEQKGLGKTLSTISSPPDITSGDPTAPGNINAAVMTLQKLVKSEQMDPKLATALSKNLLTRGVLSPAMTELPLTKMPVIEVDKLSANADKNLIKTLDTVAGEGFWKSLKSLQSVPREKVRALSKMLELAKNTGKPGDVLNWLKNNVSQLAEGGPADLENLRQIYDSYKEGSKPRTGFYNTLAELVNNALVEDNFKKAPEVWSGMDPRFLKQVYGESYPLVDKVVKEVLPQLSQVETKLNRPPSSNISNVRSVISAAQFVSRFLGPAAVASMFGIPMTVAATVSVPIIAAMLYTKPSAILNSLTQKGITTTPSTSPAMGVVAGLEGSKINDRRK